VRIFELRFDNKGKPLRSTYPHSPFVLTGATPSSSGPAKSSKSALRMTLPFVSISSHLPSA